MVEYGRPNTELRNQLIAHEGLRLKFYTDTTGHKTIGVGHNWDADPVPWLGKEEKIAKDGISEADAMRLLDYDINRAVRVLYAHYPWVAKLSDNRIAVFVDMIFNLGLGGFRSFKNMLRFASDGDFESATMHMLNSRYAKQVKGRAKTLATMLEDDISFEEARDTHA